MDRREWKNFLTKRSTIWTLSLCMTGALVLGGIAAVDSSRRSEKQQVESELNEQAYLEEELAENPEEVNDTLLDTLEEEEVSDGSIAQVSGEVAQDEPSDVEKEEVSGEEAVDAVISEVDAVDNTVANEEAGGNLAEDVTDIEAASDSVISEQALLDAGIAFTEENALMWPSAGTILIDYSMDGSIYFPTLNQYKYNPALIISSEEGNQVLASARGMVESIGVDEETGTTLVLNIGNGYKLTYGQLKELAVSEGDVVEEGALLGYISEPTKYYSEEGSNLYFKMTQNDAAVDPVLYLEG